MFLLLSGNALPPGYVYFLTSDGEYFMTSDGRYLLVRIA